MESAITFTLPSDDSQLVEQVYNHIDSNSETINISTMLTEMAKKYRFAGYIGTLDYLFNEIQHLKEELEKTKEELQRVKNKKRPWLF